MWLAPCQNYNPFTACRQWHACIWSWCFVGFVWAGSHMIYLKHCFTENSTNFANIELLLISFVLSFLQEQTKLDTTKQATSPDENDDLSPMPQSQVPPVRRRGGISAEPVTEEDATSYVKKVKQMNNKRVWYVFIKVLLVTS